MALMNGVMNVYADTQEILSLLKEEDDGEEADEP